MDSERRSGNVSGDAERALQSRQVSRLLVAVPVGVLAFVMAAAAVMRVASVHLGAAIAILILAVGTLVWAISQVVMFVRRARR
jgi:hypothetical protein